MTDIRRTRISRRAWTNDKRLAKIAKNGKPNISSSLDGLQKLNVDITISQAILDKTGHSYKKTKKKKILIKVEDSKVRHSAG
jgi:uncharacterized membrane protein